eukprot:gene7073-11236_t
MIDTTKSYSPMLSTCSLSHVLKDQQLLGLFQNHCIQEFCIENLFFLIKENEFSQAETKDELNYQAMKIYEDFLITDAPFQLNITEKKLAPIRDILISHPEKVTQQLFKSVKYEVDYLLVDCFERFKNTKDFETFSYPQPPKKKNSFGSKTKSLTKKLSAKISEYF